MSNGTNRKSVSIDLDGSRSLTSEAVGKVILAIDGVKRFGLETDFMGAFTFPQGGLAVVILMPGLPRRITMTCEEGHPEEFGTLATAVAQFIMSG